MANLHFHRYMSGWLLHCGGCQRKAAARHRDYKVVGLQHPVVRGLQSPLGPKRKWFVENVTGQEWSKRGTESSHQHQRVLDSQILSQVPVERPLLLSTICGNTWSQCNRQALARVSQGIIEGTESSIYGVCVSIAQCGKIWPPLLMLLQLAHAFLAQIGRHFLSLAPAP